MFRSWCSSVVFCIICVLFPCDLYAGSHRLRSTQITRCIKHIQVGVPSQKSFQKSRALLKQHLDFLLKNNQFQHPSSVGTIDYDVLYFWIASQENLDGEDLILLKAIMNLLLDHSPPNRMLLKILQQVSPQVGTYMGSGYESLYSWYIKLYSKLTDKESTVQIVLHLANISWQLGSRDRSAVWMRLFLQNEFSIGFSDAMFLFWYRLGIYFHEKGELAEAKRYYELFWESSAWSMANQKLESVQILIDFAAQSLNYDQVVQYYKKLQEQKLTYHKDWSKKIAVYEYVSTLGTEQFFQQWNFDIQGDSWEDLFLQGVQCVWLGTPKQAVGKFEKCMLSSPGFLPAMVSLVHLSVQQGVLQEAKNFVDVILSHFGQRMKKDQELAGRCSQLIKLVQDKVTVQKKTKSIFWHPFVLGSVLIFAGNTAEGEKQYLQCLTQKDVSSFAWEEICLYFLKETRCANSYRCFEKVVTKKIPSKELYTNQIRCFLREKQFTQAVSLLMKMEKYYPFSPDVYNDVGYSLVDNSISLHEGESFIDKALEYDPQNISFLDSKLWAQYKKKSYTKAKSIWEEKIESLLPAQDATIYYHAGLVYEKLGDHEKAQKYWKVALERGDFPEKQQLQKKFNRQ